MGAKTTAEAFVETGFCQQPPCRATNRIFRAMQLTKGSGTKKVRDAEMFGLFFLRFGLNYPLL